VFEFTGVIEGFYGTPWSWDDRIEVCRFLADHGADTYVYAPKSDPLHRDEWRTPYPTETLDAFERMVDESRVRVGFALSPGLSMRLDDADDRAALLAKFDALRKVGVDLFCLALDDIDAAPGAGRDHGSLCTWLCDVLAPEQLLLVPTDYTSVAPNRYLDQLSATTPVEVAIAWTGPTVVADTITAADARLRAAALGGRDPWLWDNYPVNDGIMTERLFMGPLRGRDEGLRDALSGYLANPMLQARASQLPVASAMAWARGADPHDTWLDVAERFGWTVFARSCDEIHLRSLIGDERREFLRAASECTAPDIESDVGAWITQIRREADVALAALDAVERADAMQLLMAIARWTRVPDPAVSVFGPRRSMRPVLGQDDQLRFAPRAGAIDLGRNAVDELIVTLADGPLQKPESTGD
jgi:hyaluronoglucosaminidase